MRLLAYVALAICGFGMVEFSDIQEILWMWGAVAMIPATMLFYQKLKEIEE